MGWFGQWFGQWFGGWFGPAGDVVILDGPLTHGAITSVRVTCGEVTVAGRLQADAVQVLRLSSDPVEVV